MGTRKQYQEIITTLESLANQENVAGMSRFGINTKNTLGISVYNLRKMAKDFKRDHALALRLWDSGIHEARILASFVEEPAKVTEEQLESWVLDFDSWDTVDQVSDLIWRTPFAVRKIHEWSKRKEEYVKRTAFSLIAELSCHARDMKDADFEQFFPIIKDAATDERNFVKKAVNWALRNIGKLSKYLNAKAILVAEELKTIDSKSARWIAADVLRELKSDAVRQRISMK